MNVILSILGNTLLVALFLYTKLVPYSAKLDPSYYRAFLFFDRLFAPLLLAIKKIIKPVKIGQGLILDISQIILFALLLLLVNLS